LFFKVIAVAIPAEELLANVIFEFAAYVHAAPNTSPTTGVEAPACVVITP